MPIHVLGTGLMTPLGKGTAQSFARWMAGEVGPASNPRWPQGSLADERAGVVADFKPRKELPDRKAVKLMSREVQLLMAAAVEAAGGTDLAERLGLDPRRIGAFAAAGYEVTPLADVLPMMAASRDEVDPSRISLARLFDCGRDLYNPIHPLKTLPNMGLSHVAIALGLRGAHMALGSSPAAGIAAFVEAIDALRYEEADAAMVLGSDAQVDVFRTSWLAECGQLGALIPSEGAAAVLLRRGSASMSGVVEIFAAGTGQEPVLGPEPHSAYGRVVDGGEARAELYARVLGEAALVGADEPDLCLADLWDDPERNKSEQAALSEILPRGCACWSSRPRMGYLGAAHAVTDVVLATKLIESGQVGTVLVTASGLAGDIGAVLVGRAA